MKANSKSAAFVSRRRELALAGASLLATPPVLAALADVLERPALVSDRSASRMMLAVTRAGDRLVCVGERGIVLWSQDHGRRWQQAAVPVSVTLTSVRFVDAQNGWACGHGSVVLRTRDGGQTWHRQLEGRAAAALTLAALKGTPAEPEAQRLVDDGPDKPLLDLWFTDALHGLVVGAYGLILATDDGGEHWRSLAADLDNARGKHLYALLQQADACYVAGEQGALYRRATGQTRFETLSSPYEGTFFGLAPAGSQALLAFGLRGHVVASLDGGRHWEERHNDRPLTCTASTTLPDGTVVLVDEGGRVRLSRNAGAHFQAVAVSAPFPFNGVAATADGALVVCGARGVARIALPVAS